MLFKVILALMGYYIGRSGMSLHEFLMLVERFIVTRNEDE